MVNFALFDVAPCFHDFNRQGTTWRKLGDDIKSSISDAAAAAGLMQAHPSVIKRPVVRWHDGECTVGFDSAAFARRIAA